MDRATAEDSRSPARHPGQDGGVGADAVLEALQLEHLVR